LLLPELISPPLFKGRAGRGSSPPCVPPLQRGGKSKEAREGWEEII